MTTREASHRLVDDLSEDEFGEAERLLKAVRIADPVLRAISLAPIDDEPERPEEAALVREGLKALAEARVVDDDDLVL